MRLARGVERDMQQISVFDMMKIGVGPSSSHTMGPWRAAQRFLQERLTDGSLAAVERLQVDLYGSLAKTGRGHGTDVAIMMGLRGEDPVTCDTALIGEKVLEIRREKEIRLRQERSIPFDPDQDLIFNYDQTLPYHPNGMRFAAVLADGGMIAATYYSIGGGFVVSEGEEDFEASVIRLPYPTQRGEDVLTYCLAEEVPISQIVLENEKQWRSEAQIRVGLLQIWEAMAESVFRGCFTEGVLSGGLGVQRRAPNMHRKLFSEGSRCGTYKEWISSIQEHRYNFHRIVKWVSCFALAVNEENAAFWPCCDGADKWCSRRDSRRFDVPDLFLRNERRGHRSFLARSRRDWRVVQKRGHYLGGDGRLSGGDRRFLSDGRRCPV